MHYVIAVAVIGFIILIHEAGHLLAARAAGIPVERFSIGFGPALARMRRGGTEYRLCAVPLGGYLLPAVRDEQEYFSIAPYRRVLLSLGGPLANIAAALLLFAAYSIAVSGPTVEGALIGPFSKTVNFITQFFSSIAGIFSGHDKLSGAIGIVAQGGAFIKVDAARTAVFAAVLNLNLGFFNLLPVPALDGGKVLLGLAEMLFPAARKAHAPLAIAGWIVMLGLLVYATALDIGRMMS
jgi:regulator of sigma E protease